MAYLLTRARAQLYVMLTLFGLWVVGLLLAQFDGSTMVKVMTPFMTVSLGWLFTAKATDS